jgi:hypothetical protein
MTAKALEIPPLPYAGEKARLYGHSILFDAGRPSGSQH